MEASSYIFSFNTTMDRYLSRILKILVFIFLIIIIDQITGTLLRKLYFRQKAGHDQALIYAFNDCKADILIFGASQAQHNYDPRILSDSLNMTCYNAGQDGGHSIIMQYAQILVITKRYSPKIILLEFHPDKIVHYPGDYDRLSILLPYYKLYPELRPIIHLRSPYEKIKLLSSIYPFNSKVINLVRYNTNTHAARKQDVDGFLPITNKEMNFEMLKTRPEKAAQFLIDTNMINALKNIISICKEKNISLFLVYSPIFHKVDEKQSPSSYIADLSLQIINKEKVNYRDFSFDSIFAGKMDLFVDKVHLNSRGATLFSENLAHWIKKKLLPNDSIGVLLKH
jgi:hypothetical protein